MASGSRAPPDDPDEEDDIDGGVKLKDTPVHFNNFLAVAKHSLKMYHDLGLTTNVTKNNKDQLDLLTQAWSAGFSAKYQLDPRSLALMTTLKENCSSKFKMDLDPACFQLDGATIIIIDYDILKPFWKKTLSEKVIHYRFTVLYIQ